VRSTPTDTLALLKDLSTGVSAWISYQIREQEGTQSPTQTLERGCGSCRGGSGQNVHRRFCPNCSSGVVVEIDYRPGMMLVAAGTLDDPSSFVPDVEIFCDSAQAWVHAGDERKRFPRAPG
jgi:hypothetical protein